MSETWAAQMMRWAHEALIFDSPARLPYIGVRQTMWLGSLMNETSHHQTWAKRHRASDAEDAETWESTDTAPTLSAFDQGDVRAVTLVTYAIEDFRGKQSGGPEVGLGVAEGTMFTLQANGHEHAVSISSSEGSPARTSAWPANGPDFPASAAVSGLSSLASLKNYGHAGASSRMLPGFSLVDSPPEATLGSSSTPWSNSGTAWPGGRSTHSMPESLRGGVASSLSEVLETEPPPQRYWLSAKAAAGILRRAERRGKELPEPLALALSALAASMEATTPQVDTSPTLPTP